LKQPSWQHNEWRHAFSQQLVAKRACSLTSHVKTLCTVQYIVSGVYCSHASSSNTSHCIPSGIMIRQVNKTSSLRMKLKCKYYFENNLIIVVAPRWLVTNFVSPYLKTYLIKTKLFMCIWYIPTIHTHVTYNVYLLNLSDVKISFYYREILTVNVLKDPNSEMITILNQKRNFRKVCASCSRVPLRCTHIYM
jgi:hypothetical protein